MLDGCMRSVMAAPGEERFDSGFFAALTSGIFRQMFDPARTLDSCTQDFFESSVAVNAFSACGSA